MWKFSTEMAVNLKQRLDSLSSKALLLTERYASLSESYRGALQQIADLQATLERKEKEISLLNQQIEQLRVVSVIAPNHEDVEHSRRFLAELVRDIDKCISELSE